MTRLGRRVGALSAGRVMAAAFVAVSLVDAGCHGYAAHTSSRGAQPCPEPSFGAVAVTCPDIHGPAPARLTCRVSHPGVIATMTAA